MAGLEISNITRAQDFSIIKHNEDLKPMTDQTVISQEVEKQQSAMTDEVNHTSESEWYQRKEDASKKGDNEYSGDGGAKRPGKGTKNRPPDQVVVKGRSNGFDLKV